MTTPLTASTSRLELSSIGTHLSYDCASNEFRYDSDESSWNLIPI